MRPCSPLRAARVMVQAGVAALAAVAALLAFAVAPAGRIGRTARRRAHVPRHDRLRRPGLRPNFNPYTATGPALRRSSSRAPFYEPLIVTGEGGLKPVPWLARSWKWSNGNKTLTLNLAHKAKWSDGKPLTSARRRLQPRRPASRTRSWTGSGYTRADANEVASSTPRASTASRSAEDAGLAVHRGDAQPAVRRPAAHLDEVKDPTTYLNPKPVGSGPFNVITRFTTQDYVLGKNPHYWQPGMPKLPCLEYVQAASNDAALALIQSGQADWTHNFVPNVDNGVRREGPEALPRVLRDDRVPDLAHPRRHAVPVQPARPSARRSAWRSTATPSRSSASTATPPDRRDRPQRPLPEVGQDPP